MKALGSRAGAANARRVISAEIIGAIVITKYNNKTYRVDDINWDGNPTSKCFDSY